MARFFPLTVTEIRPETREAVAITLQPAEADREAFRYMQGQYLTFRKEFDGEELRRSYSICTGVDDNVLRIGVKRVAGGAFSNWANTELKPGDVVEAMPPAGEFNAPIEAEMRRHYLMFAGGSGITPVLGLIRTPEVVANCVFGGAKRNRLFIAATTSLYAIYVMARGARP